jgi:hypothetical protein
MKKIIFVALLLMASPALATVTITVDPGLDPCTVVIGFTSDEANNVRAFALDIMLDDPCATICDINCVSAGYNIYPGAKGIKIDDSGVVTDYGSCEGDPAQGPAGGTLGGLDTNGVTVEMGSLYEVGVDPPPAQSGDLVILTLCGCDSSGDANIVVSVAENSIRGGVVMENPDEVVTVDTSDTALVPMGTCDICQCYGDITGSTGPDPDNLVNTADLSKLLGLLGPLSGASPPYEVCPVPAGYECMDIAGTTGPEPDGCINTADLSKLLGYLGPLSGSSPPYEGPCMTDIP